MNEVAQIGGRPKRSIHIVTNQCMNQLAGLSSNCSRGITISCAQHEYCAGSLLPNPLNKLRIRVWSAATKDPLID